MRLTSNLMRLAVALGALLPSVLFAANPPATAPIEGLRDATPRVHALVGARVVTAPGQVLENATIVVRDGVIEAVGADVTPPPDARMWDVKGRTIYAGFIESESTLFLPAAWKSGAARRSEGEDTAPPAAPAPTTETADTVATGARAWNSRVTPERLAHRALVPDDAGATALRKLGFAVAHVVPSRGVFRGRTTLVSLGRGGFNRTVLRDAVAQPVAFEQTGPGGGYPVSLMGATALIRQTLLDARWYMDVKARYQERREGGVARPETNDALAALEPVVKGEQPVWFTLGDELDLPRAASVAAEFKLKLILRGSGYDYRTLRQLPEGVPVIVPLNFPEAPEVENAEHALDISLDKLEHWELAPTSPGRLAAKTSIALTTSGLRRPDTQFWSHLRLAVQRGLPADTALAALTVTPAELLGVTRTHGTIAAGKTASLVVASGDLFKSDDAEIQLMWVDGEPFELESWRRFDARGTWRIAWQGAPEKAPAEIKLTGRSATRLRASAGGPDVAVRSDGETYHVLAPAKWFGLDRGTIRLTARAEGGKLLGVGELPDGKALRWQAERTAAAAEAAKPAEKKSEPIIARTDAYPAGAFGRAGGLPEQPASVLVKNATIWTSGSAGTLEGADLLIEKGKIVQVGKGLTAPAGAITIDAAGKHVSAGLIDCHSHLALDRGVNEGTHSVTVEVRVADALDPTDIGIYRVLAGGVTSANILHGSANAMGGQNQVIKMRWGASAEELKFAGAMPGVKFALGENVTRKNSSTLPTRYPISRMGVPEIMLDTFTRARDYERELAQFAAGKSSLPPRRDLRLDAALEILRGQRLIHIHSYRQDEVLAFIRLAQQLKLPVATFQHILEGYKVADQIAAIGAGGSCFADWWAYKHEVTDAIPYDGALMRSAGVVVSFNSDDDELARHLNTEAAKAVKYGGVPPEEALKFVTLNPAKQLRIDARVGSLEPGKDADFVIWSAPPLSTYARPEQTWIDGRKYFDIADDAKTRTDAEAERVALIQKILPERQRILAGGTTGGSGPGAGAASEGGGDDSSKPTILQVLERLAAQHSEMRAIYHDGGSAHNCTTAEGGAR